MFATPHVRAPLWRASAPALVEKSWRRGGTYVSGSSTSGLGHWTMRRSPRLRRRRGHSLTCPLPPWRGRLGWPSPAMGRADWVPIPRGLIALLRRRGERRWNEHLRLLAYRPLATLGRPGRQFHRLLANALPRCQIGVRPDMHPAIQPTDVTRHTSGNRRELGAPGQRCFPG